ncbi:nitroreductase family protein [Parasutterella secunda]|uniref:nitroreductase family protein n=1 Tax=Parasutterella secunda TaxID=626947 RepID=UPI002013532F|nr:nitroreductase family protein [Parasutterella secunda]MCL1596358.1 nitroreductase family protein [Parasutterella secunda]MCR8919679.1 nitroreductase family protein [Parasutterella secunda]
MPVKAKFKNSIENLKSELKERQERLIKDWESAKRDLKARQKLFTREIKTKQDEFFLEWDDVQERSREKLDQWLDRFEIDELQAMLDRYKEENEPLETIGENDVLRQLPSPRKLEMTLQEALEKRRSSRDFSGEPIAEEMVAALLWAANGINRKNFKRTTPSALNWQDVSVYVVQANGIWKYLPKRHALLFIEGKDQREHFGEIKTWMKLASQHLVFVSDARKTETFTTKLLDKTFKVDFSEGELNERARAINVGVKVQAVYLAAVAMGLGCTCRLLVDDQKARELMKLAPDEKIMAICSVGEHPASIFDHVI